MLCSERPGIASPRAFNGVLERNSGDHHASLSETLPVAALTGVTAPLLAPALVCGVALGEHLRRRGARWTWTLPIALPPTVLAAVEAPNAADRLHDAGALLASGTIDAGAILAAGALPWAAAVAPTAAMWKLWRDRRDRLHGGARERAVADAIGPLDWLRITRARVREAGRGPLTADGVLLGTDHRGAPIRIPELTAHATIVGGSNSGKTHTAKVLLEGHVAGGAGFVVLDGKGGTDLPRLALALGARHGRPVALWSLRPYGDTSLDVHRLPWNVLGDGDATEIKDRIATSEEQSEPYYRAVAARGVLAATRVLGESGDAVRLDALAAALEQPARLRSALAGTAPDDAAWLASLGESERSALRGMASRLRTMVASDGAEALLPDKAGREIRLHDAVRDGWLVVFTLPQGVYPELVPHVTRYALQALNAVCARIEATGRPANTLVFVDELSAFDGDQLCAGFERGRSAGVRFVVATQSLSNLETAGGKKLLHAALDNAELAVIHRQAVPEAAEFLASVGGTEETWEHTHKVRDASGRRLGWDETGERARRLVDRFKTHPNVIKTLPRGEAIIIPTAGDHRPARVRVREVADARRARARAYGTPPRESRWIREVQE